MPLYPGALEFLDADVAQRIGQGAAVAAAITKEHISLGARHGKHHPGLPHVSSSPAEYPQEQFGDLIRSVGFEHVNGTTYEVGSIHNPPPEALDLEERPKIYGGRPWLSRSMESGETHALMLAAAALD